VKRDLLRFLVCPACREPFRLVIEERDGDEVVRGRLGCGRCETAYPVTGGVPRVLPPVLIEEQERTARSFGWQWTRFSRLHDATLYTEQFLDWIAPLSREDVRGKVVLDGGCGMGRFSLVCSQLGAAAVIAVDLSRATDAAYANTRHRSNVHVVQADLHHLPFRTDPGDFDFVFSIGVLHHLPDPEAGFRALTHHLEPGGTMSAWVYGYENNEWLIRYVNPIRLWITSRLPRPLLYALSFAIALPVQAILKMAYAPVDRLPALAALRSRLPYAYLFWLSRFGLRHTHHVIFDHLAAPKADYLRREEFAAWFDRAGLTDKTVTARNENSWRGYGRKPLAPVT